jgi:hypothetical protein
MIVRVFGKDQSQQGIRQGLGIGNEIRYGEERECEDW